MEEAIKLVVAFAGKYLNKLILVILIVGSFICPASLFIFFYERTEFTLMTASKLIILSLALELPIYFLGFTTLFVIVHFDKNLRNKIEKFLRNLNFIVKVEDKENPVVDVFTPTTIFVSMLTIFIFFIPVVGQFIWEATGIGSGLWRLFLVFIFSYIPILLLYAVSRNFLAVLLICLSLVLAIILPVQKLSFEIILRLILIIIAIGGVKLARK